MHKEKAMQLSEQGRLLLDREEFAEAEEKFVQALAEAEDPVVRNNLAMARFLLGKPEEALQTLEGFDDEWPNPFRKSLMAQCLVALGKIKEAGSMVRAAVRDFDQLGQMRASGFAMDEAYRQYTVMVMRGAGAIADHRQVLDLYKRWQKYHVSWENKYLAGVAAFNLKRFRQAAAYWSGIRELPYAHQLQLICVLADHGVVPPFALEYEVISGAALKEAAQGKNIEAMVAQSGVLKMLFLMSVLDEQRQEQTAVSALDALVVHGGEWGRSLGLEFLEAAMIPEKIKVMAAQALVKAGVFAEGDKVPILVDGETRYIRVSQVEVTWEPEQYVIEQYNRALALRDRGKRKEAQDLLTELITGRVIFPPALLVLANLYRDQNKPDSARPLLETLETIAPDHPIILYNLAGYWLEQGDSDKAGEYFARIDASQGDDEFQKKLDWLQNAIEQGMDTEVNYYAEDKRTEIEEKKLPTEPTMTRGLKNMPVQWVRQACAFWQVDCEHRKEGEAALVAVAGSAAGVRRAVLALSPEERELLQYVLDRGGFVRVSAITRKFGSMEGDGFLGEKEPPRSVLGGLWLKAFVFVGRALVGGRNEKIAAVPVELREELKRVLDTDAK
ncbi:MAG: tetratricopeptide repeat protein [Bacillota bacterium]|nr:tetratricopeptide repeat protein [Bacillota bacterium]MDW7682696.1 tetratricopeptide repeat protein [Bacillota bacterium]